MSVPAFIADIREDETLLSKAVIPIPIQASAANTPIAHPYISSGYGIIKPELPIQPAYLAQGKFLYTDNMNSK